MNYIHIVRKKQFLNNHGKHTNYALHPYSCNKITIKRRYLIESGDWKPKNSPRTLGTTPQIK